MPLIILTTFTSCVNQLLAKKVFPFQEQIRLKAFESSLSESLSLAAYYQREMKEKHDLIDQFAHTSKYLDTLGNTIHQLKGRLQQIDVEENELLDRLNNLREERKSILAQKEVIN